MNIVVFSEPVGRCEESLCCWQRIRNRAQTQQGSSSMTSETALRRSKGHPARRQYTVK